MPDVMHSSSEPKKSTLADFGRAQVGRARRWVENTFTQENLSSAAKTLAWVAPLTVLIWVYAEREQLTRTEDPIPIPINVTTGDPTRVVTLLRPQEKVILADLAGPRSELDAVRNQFVRSEGTKSLDLLIDRLQLSVGLHEVQTVRLVGNHPMFDGGIEVTTCQPPTLQVLVDVYEEREVAVEPPPQLTNLVGTPVFNPPRVRVRAPRGELNRIEALHVYADLASAPQLASPGTHDLQNVRVTTPGLESSPHATYSPTTVKVTVEVRQADERYEMPFMAVYAQVPASLQKEYSVECPDTIPNVWVVGPPDKIALLKAESPDIMRPYAKVEISREDLPAGTVRTRRLKYEMPEGVRVAAEELQHEVNIKLVGRGMEQ